MGNKLTQSQVAGISVAVLALFLVLLMLTKIIQKRGFKGSFYKKYRHISSGKNVSLRQSIKKSDFPVLPVFPVFPVFPYGELTEVYIQPPIFTDQIQAIEEKDSGSKLHRACAGTLYINVRYDLSRSILVLSLLKAIDLPVNETNETNFYITTNVFPQKHKSFQSCVYKTSAPEFNETFEFTLPLKYILLQSLKFSLWSFDRFSHHEVVADGLLHLNDLEKYGLSISREICVAKKLGLVPKASGVCGKIFLSLGYLRLAERLAVVVIKAINLSKINNELPDPYVAVSLLCADEKPQVKKTSAKPSEQNPMYNETLTFNVPAERLHETSLYFSVQSKKENSRNIEVLGNVFLGPEACGESFDHWDYMRTCTKPTGKWHQLFRNSFK